MSDESFESAIPVTAPRSLPANEDTERRLLSTLMMGASGVQSSVAAGLVAEAFFSHKHAFLFKAICVAATSGLGTGAFQVFRVATGLEGGTPDVAELSNIAGLESTSLRRSQFTEDVLALWQQRRLIEALDEARRQASAKAQNWTDLWERVQPHIQAANETSTCLTATRDIGAMVSDARTLIREPNVGSLPGPFSSWDRISKPLRAKQLAVLAGRPGTGKTAIALQYVTETMRGGKHVAMFSLEMAGDELLHRMAHQISRSTDKDALLRALEEIDTKFLHLHEARDHSSLAQIEARTKLLASTYPLGLVVVDYLGLVRPPKTMVRENREQQVAAMSRTFKLLAGQLPCPLLLLCQLNRESEKDKRKPFLSDLRESGAIEQDADCVWFLWEAPTDGPMDSESERAEVHLIQAKRRNGQPNVFMRLSFHRPTLTFTPIIANGFDGRVAERTDEASRRFPT